jgi:hypothetical protein
MRGGAAYLRHSEVLAQRSSFRDEDVGRTAHGLCQIGSLPEVCFSDLSRYVASIIAARDMSGVRCKSEVTSSQPSDAFDVWHILWNRRG